MAAVLVLLIVSYLAVGSFSSADDDTTAADTTVTYPVADVDPAKVTRISMQVKYHGDGDDEHKYSTLSFILSDQKWSFEEHPDIPMDSDLAKDILNALSDETSDEMLTGVSAEKLAEYGLSEPSVKLTLTYADKTESEYLIGDKNSFNGMYYFLDCSNAATVYMVSEELSELLSGDLIDFVLYDELPAIPDGDAVSLTWEKDGTKRVYTYYPKGKTDDYTDDYLWYLSINGGEEFAVDEDVAATLCEALETMSYIDCVSYNSEKDAELGLDSAGKLSIVAKNGSVSLLVGDMADGENYYVRPEPSPLAYMLSEAASEAFELLIFGEERKLRPDEIFKGDYSRVDGITFTARENTLSVLLTHAGNKISYSCDDGAELDYNAFALICEELEKATATSYTSVYEGDGAYGNDIIFKAVFRFNSGKVPEASLEISRYSEKYCKVSFMGREDQLITLEKAEKMASLLADYFAQ